MNITMLTKKPYDKSPYDLFKKLKAPWMDKLTCDVQNDIDNMYVAIYIESMRDGLRALSDEEFLYQRFVENCKYGMMYANWQVLKYFKAFLEIKVLKEMIGDWSFTDHDLEMYNYFSGFRSDGDDKLKNSMIAFSQRFISDTFNSPISDKEFAFFYNDEYITYSMIYASSRVFIDNMVRRCLGLKNDGVDWKLNENHIRFGLFERWNYHKVISGRITLNSSRLPVYNEEKQTIGYIKANKVTPSRKPNHYTVAALGTVFHDFCRQSNEFIELHERLTNLVQSLYEKYVAENPHLFGRITSDEYKEILRSTVRSTCAGVDK